MQGLQVFHLPKKAVHDLDGSRPCSGFYMDTCQRWVWLSHVSDSSLSSEVCLNSGHSLNPSWIQSQPSTEVYQGYEAYLFLLRFATGLESEVQGETDIFGQIKDAWKREIALRPHLCQELGPWMQRLFEDTKDIRTRFLQNVGGASYGSLTRKLIKQSSKSDSDGPVLIVGAGKIAQSIAPFLLDQEVWLWNRSEQGLFQLTSDLMKRFAERNSIQLKPFAPSDEAKVWREAKHVVACIPLDATQDLKRVAWFREGGQLSERSIIHLGGRSQDCQIWNSLPQFYSLDEIFKLEKSSGKVRSVQLIKALKACEERAKLRSLGHSLSIPHGWEDLASFA